MYIERLRNSSETIYKVDSVEARLSSLTESVLVFFITVALSCLMSFCYKGDSYTDCTHSKRKTKPEDKTKTSLSINFS